MGHTFQHYLSFADAFHGKSAEFNPKVLRLLTDWFKEQQPKKRHAASGDSSSKLIR
jgi:hypothetical protein